MAAVVRKSHTFSEMILVKTELHATIPHQYNLQILEAHIAKTEFGRIIIIFQTYLLFGQI